MKSRLTTFFLVILCISAQTSKAADIIQATNESHQFDVGTDGFSVPFDGVITQDSRFFYVSGALIPAISIYDTSGLSHLKTYISSDAGFSNLSESSKLVLSPQLNNPYLFVLSPAPANSTDISDKLLVFSRQTSGVQEAELQPLTEFVNNSATLGILSPVDMVVSSDGNYVYVASSGDKSIAVFQLNTTIPSIDMIQVVQNNTVNNGKTVTGLNNPTALTLSADGKNLYVVGYDEDALAIFSRDQSSGTISYVNTLTQGSVTAGGTAVGLDGPISIVNSNDDKNIYVASELSGTIAAFSRDSVTGGLNFITAYDSSSLDACQNVNCLASIYRLYTTKSNANLFALNTDETITALKRIPWNGQLEIKHVYEQAAAASEYSSFLVAPNGDFAYALISSGVVNKYDLLNAGLTVGQVNNVDVIDVNKAFDYQFVVTNNGPSDADDVLFETKFMGATSAMFTDTSDPTHCTTLNDQVTCRTPTPPILAGGSTTITVHAISPSSDQILNNETTVYADQINSGEGKLQMTTKVCTIAPPVAAAQVVGGDTYDEGYPDPVNLDAGASSSDCGVISKYEWLQLSGPGVNLQNVNSAAASFNVPLNVIGNTDLVFQVTVTDDTGASDSTTVTVTVVDVSTPPVAIADFCAVPPGSTTSIPVLENDMPQSAGLLSVASITGDSLSGSAVNKTTSIQYIAPVDIATESIIDTIKYFATDGTSLSNESTASVLVTKVPTVTNDVISVDNDSTNPVTIYVLENDSVSGGSLQLVSVDAQSVNGNALQVTPDNKVIYTPSGDKTTGQDSFRYYVTSSTTKDFADANGLTLDPNNPCLQTIVAGTVTLNLSVPANTTSGKPSQNSASGGGGGAMTPYFLLSVLVIWLTAGCFLRRHIG